VLTALEAQELAAHKGKLSFSVPLVSRVTAQVIAVTDAAITDQSYALIETKGDGHDWHYDTGDMNHMPWCRFSASVLLSDNFTGGMFQFEKPFDEHRHFLSALIYSSDQLHRVTPHKGTRSVLLIFLGAKDDQRR
jgi:hypothetical protein